MSNEQDPFSRRKTEPSVKAQHPGEYRARDPKATIQPGSEPGRVFDRPASTLADLDERQAQRMIDLASMLRDDNAKRAAAFDVKLEAQEKRLEAKIDALTVPALGAVGRTSPPITMPGNPGDVMIPVRAKVPSMTGDPHVDAKRLADLERENQEDSMRYRSLAETVGALQVQAARVESAVKAQPAATEAAAQKVAEAAQAQVTSLERVLTNKNVTHLIYLVIALVVASAAQTAVTRGLTKEAVHEGVKEGTTEAAAAAKPSVVIVREKEDPTP